MRTVAPRHSWRSAGRCRPDEDHAGPRPAFPLEVDVDADFAQEGCRPAQPAPQARGFSGPSLGLGDAFAYGLGQGAQKVEAVPVHAARTVMMARTAAAIGSASITPTTVSSRFSA